MHHEVVINRAHATLLSRKVSILYLGEDDQAPERDGLDFGTLLVDGPKRRPVFWPQILSGKRDTPLWAFTLC